MLFSRLFAAVLFFAGAGCSIQCNPDDHDPRGERVRTAGRGTTPTVDGTPWKFPLGVGGPGKPGLHTGESIDVDTPAGYASTLDFWGP